jgi:hypothetical protein
MRISIAVALLSSLSLSAQEAPPFKIRLDKEVVVSGLSNAVTTGESRCDDSGAVYLRTFVAGAAASSVVLRLAPDGGYSYFNFHNLPDNASKGLRVEDFAVDGKTVYMLALKAEDKQPVKILRFDGDGTFKKLTTLDADFFPFRLAVFATGQFLVTGLRTGEPGKHETVAYLFDSAGRVLKIMDLDEDLGSKSGRGKAADPEKAGLGLLDAAGYVAYLLPHGENPVVYVISASGTAMRELKLKGPGDGFQPVQLRASAVEFLVEYATMPEKGNSEYRYVTYDAMTGAVLRQYEPESIKLGNFGCFDWKNGFTLFSSDASRHRVVQRATAR